MIKAKELDIYNMLKKLGIRIKTENVDSMFNDKTYERTIVELYFKAEDGSEYFICDDFIDKEIKE